MQKEEDLFIKHGRPGMTSLEGEAASLAWLGEARADGGMPVAEVVRVSATELVERRVTTCTPSTAAAERVGRALAVMHAAGAAWWGAPPTGWSGDHLIDGSHTPTVITGAEAPSTWGAFYATYRVEAYVEQALERGVLTNSEAAEFARLAEWLREGTYDAPQPDLVRANGHAVARIHGDLWAGNLLWNADPTNPVGAALIDPMAHGGHAETDLAMLALFGCPQLDRIIAAYNEVSPLADGWCDRVRLHQLAPLLHHCVLFGRPYVPDALAVVHAYLA